MFKISVDADPQGLGLRQFGGSLAQGRWGAGVFSTIPIGAVDGRGIYGGVRNSGPKSNLHVIYGWLNRWHDTEAGFWDRSQVSDILMHWLARAVLWIGLNRHFLAECCRKKRETDKLSWKKGPIIETDWDGVSKKWCGVAPALFSIKPKTRTCVPHSNQTMRIYEVVPGGFQFLALFSTSFLMSFPTCQVRVVRFYQSCSPPPPPPPRIDALENCLDVGTSLYLPGRL